jgi:hypothetical protein
LPIVPTVGDSHKAFSVVSGICSFCKFAQVALKACTNITATIPPENMKEITSCLNCIPVAKHQQKISIFILFSSLFVSKENRQTKGQIRKTLSVKAQNL